MGSDEINALPDRIRAYIHDLETRCDPSGELRELVCRREQVEALSVVIARLRTYNSFLLSCCLSGEIPRQEILDQMNCGEALP